MSVERVSYEIMQDLRTGIARVSKLKLQCKVFPCINLPVESNVTSPFDKSFHCIAYIQCPHSVYTSQSQLHSLSCPAAVGN